jgi:serpin B
VIITSQSRASADEIVKALAGVGKLEDLSRGVGFVRRRGLVEIPRHRIDFGLDLRESLMRLGLTQAFGPGADFSRLSRDPLSLSAVRHRAVLTVDETGAEAAAATAVTVPRAMVWAEPPLHFVADRPFVAILVNSDAPSWPLMVAVVRDL